MVRVEAKSELKCGIRPGPGAALSGVAPLISRHHAADAKVAFFAALAAHFKVRSGWSSAHCRKPRPALSRNSSCASAPNGVERVAKKGRPKPP
jgi:hypothetical protein